MARPPKIRASYRNDSMFMVRLISAVQRDDKRTPEWRAEVIGHLDALSRLFINAADIDRTPLHPSHAIEVKAPT